MIKFNIKLTNQKQIKSFYNRLWIYKSFIFKYTRFEIETTYKDEQIKMIQIALNIKNRKERINYIYDQSCAMIDEKNKNINICGFENNKCFVQRKLNNGKYNGCCRNCLYQDKHGCPTKNLACKMFNCSEVISKYEVIKYENLKLLKLLSFKNQIIIKSDYFSKREDVLKDLYLYTFTFTITRIIIRLIKNLTRLKHKNFNKEES